MRHVQADQVQGGGHHHLHRQIEIRLRRQKRDIVQDTRIVHQNVKAARLGDGIEIAVRIGQIDPDKGHAQFGSRPAALVLVPRPKGDGAALGL
jgi:hypothetical protein